MFALHCTLRILSQIWVFLLKAVRHHLWSHMHVKYTTVLLSGFFYIPILRLFYPYLWSWFKLRDYYKSPFYCLTPAQFVFSPLRGSISRTGSLSLLSLFPSTTSWYSWPCFLKCFVVDCWRTENIFSAFLPVAIRLFLFVWTHEGSVGLSCHCWWCIVWNSVL